GRRDEIGEEVEAPATQLGAVAQVEVFRQRVVLPAARIDDGGPAPDARRSVEVEEVPGAVPAAVLEDEVAIEQDRLYPREQRVLLVDVAPARLDHTDLRVGEMMNRTEE